MEPFHSVQDDEFNVPQMHMDPLLYSSLLYQHQAEASRFQMPHNISNNHGELKVKQSRHSQTNKSSAKRIPLTGNLTEDDILEMVMEFHLNLYY